MLGAAQPAFTIPLKVHKIEIFFGFDFEIRLFLCYLCQNIKILPKQFFDQAIIGGGTIFPRSLKTTGNKNCFQPRPKIFFFNIIYNPFIFAKNSFFQNLIH